MTVYHYLTFATSLALGAVPASPRPAACQLRVASSATGALPAYRQIARDVMMRTRLVADSTTQGCVEVWDVLVSPGARAAALTPPGAAVVEVRGGAGRGRVGAVEHPLRGGVTFALAEGDSLVITNARVDLGLALRLFVVRRP